MTQETPFFKAGGTLSLKDRCYVTRPADDELYHRVLAGDFCYVLTPRQMGKSSLMVRSADRLEREAQLAVVKIDLTEIGLAPLDQWYVSVLGRIQRQLRLTVKAETWWTDKAAFTPTDRFTRYLREVVLTECQTQVVIFIDEIDTTLQFEFRDDFFAAIRAMYNARATETAFERLTFVLFGVASPSDLIQDRSRTPFNIGQAIPLEEFSRPDAKPLEEELERLYPQQGAAILNRIFDWTSGYPYLTLKLAQEVATHGGEVDEVVRRLFLDVDMGQEANLKFVRDRLLEGEYKRELLQIYKRIYEGEKVKDDEQSIIYNRLKLSGVVKVKNGQLQVRNEIYRQVFNLQWVNENNPTIQFIAGGTLRADAPCYVTRLADQYLLDKILERQFCYVLTSRQMGKSSLMIRTAQKLDTKGMGTAIVDLTTLGTQITPQQWYLAVVDSISETLGLTSDWYSWWQAQKELNHVKLFTNFLRDVVLREIQGQVVIFIDEIDTTIQLDFRDDFFAAIRAMYNARATESAFERLTFVLLGVASPSDLTRDRSRTPFNIGQAIPLEEFSRPDAKPLEDELERLYPRHGAAILDRIFHWTSGHPYLTLKLAGEVAVHGGEVDKLVQRLFLNVDMRKESNLQFLQSLILDHKERNNLLKLYKQIYQGKQVKDRTEQDKVEEESPLKNRLKLAGLVKAEKDVLQIRNKIYREVFNLKWINTNLSVDRTRYYQLAVAVLFLVIMLGSYFVGNTLLCRESCDLVTMYGENNAQVGDTVLYSYFVKGFPDKIITKVDISTAPAIPSSPHRIGGDDNLNERLEPGETWVYFNMYVITSSEPTSLVNRAVVTITIEGNEEREERVDLTYTTIIEDRSIK